MPIEGTAMARIGAHTAEKMADPTRGMVMRGVAAGVIGALVMGLIAMIVSAAAGAGFFMPVMLIGATYLGEGFNDAPAWSAILGFITHLVVGGAFGALFVALARNITATSAKLAAGVAYGAAVYLFMTFLVMPWADPVMYASIDKGLFFLFHLVYGAIVPLALMRAPRAFGDQRRPAY
jgi:hypothetical protein